MGELQEAQGVIIQMCLPGDGAGLGEGGTLDRRLSRPQMASTIDIIRSEIYTDDHICPVEKGWQGHSSGIRDTRKVPHPSQRR